VDERMTAAAILLNCARGCSARSRESTTRGASIFPLPFVFCQFVFRQFGADLHQRSALQLGKPRAFNLDNDGTKNCWLKQEFSRLPFFLPQYWARPYRWFQS
jgi:hypothetical protein